MSHHARSSSPDSVAAGELRFALKICALAYDGSRMGIDASSDVVGLALSDLCAASARYYECLQGTRVEISAPRDRAGMAAIGRIQLAAIAYAATRYGADACPELSRAALGVLCDAAIAVCETCGVVADPSKALLKSGG